MQFVEKRKELKQDGRTEKELAESFCFLFSDKVSLKASSEMFCFLKEPFMVLHEWLHTYR